MIVILDDLQRIPDWFIGNGLCVNPAKLQMIFLGIKVNSCLCLNIDGQKVEQVENVKLVSK